MRFCRVSIILFLTILSTGINTSSASGVVITPSMQSVEKSPCSTSQSLSDMDFLIDLIEKNYPNDLEETKPIKSKLNLAIQECEASKDKKLDIDRVKVLIAEVTNLVLKLQKNNNGVSQISKFNLVTSSDHTTGYNRALFKHWIDADKDGCNTRAEVLIEEAVTKPKVGSKCSLTGGKWLSAYDGKSVNKPSELDVDHMVPLAEAWRSGAWKWSSSQRQAYANDLDDARALIAVTLSTNRSKGDKDPALWMPPKEQCTYAENWIAVKVKYSLTVDVNEAIKLNLLIDSCGLGVSNTPTPTPTVSSTPTITPLVTPSATPTPSTTSSALIVSPGAFCSPAGAIGKSTSGVSYTCKTSPTDTRNRWRQ